ncbi:unnamed protein product [Zymoseptoria tritici ST99CH_3D1]|nr:unnamed protein product [Zymoseptoria tritici ST99CH_3D1]
MGSKAPSEAQIPIIDISSANPNAPAQLLDAARNYGFVFISNKDDAAVPSRLVNDIFDLSKQFFDLPVEEKEKVSIASNSAGKNHGWLSQGVEKLDPASQKRPDVKEAFNLAPHTSLKFPQPLPSLFLQPANHTLLTTFQTACQTLSDRLLVHFATALEIPSDWFTTRHSSSGGAHSSIFRLLYYPKLHSSMESGNKDDLRAGAHSDYGSLTLLFRLPHQSGLEILTPSGEWESVALDPLGTAKTPGEMPILVNIGDLLEDWTGGLLKSTVHRVVFPASISSTDGQEGEVDDSDRYSVAYFCHPLDEVLLEPVPSRVVEEWERQNGKREGRDGCTAGEHLMRRLRATYSVK